MSWRKCVSLYIKQTQNLVNFDPASLDMSKVFQGNAQS